MSPTTYWHSTLNETPNPTAVTSKKAWWICDKEHVFLTKAKSVNKPPTCKICSNQTLLIGFNDLATTHPELAKEWHPTLNKPLTPQQVTPTKVKKVWWLGRDCGHEWEMTINTRAIPRKGTLKTGGCPYCAGTLVIPGKTDLATTHPHMAKNWHPAKNENCEPTQISAGSHKSVWWLGECGHEWERVIYRQQNGKCPTCTGHQLTPGVNDLQTKYPKIAAQWHFIKNYPLAPNQISSKNGKKVWWQCEKGHEWESKISNRTTSSTDCPYCTNRKILSGFNDLSTTHPKLSTQFHLTKNNPLTPTSILAGSSRNIWWQCEKGHEWEATPSNRSSLDSNCPACAANTYVSQGEKDIVTYLNLLGVVTETSIRNLIKGELDIYLPAYKIAIEYNGLYWHSEKAGRDKTYHRNKWEQCQKQGIQLIQIWEDDWKTKPLLVKQMIAHKLGLNTQPTTYARKTTIQPVSSSEAQLFLNKNHLQGYRSAKYWGLYTKTSPQELVAIIGTQQKQTSLEIIRYATSQKIPGGFTKLLKHAQTQHPTITQINTYSHNDHATGGLYENNGFTAKHNGTPGYSYWKYGWATRQNRLKYSPSAIRKNPALKSEEGLSERELALLNNLIRIWDSGSTLWVKTIPTE